MQTGGRKTSSTSGVAKTGQRHAKNVKDMSLTTWTKVKSK